MTRWKKDEIEFEVQLTDDHHNSMICRVPKPICDLLGNPVSIKFNIVDKKIIVSAGNKS